MREKLMVEFSTWSIVKLILLIISFYVLFLIKDIIALFFIVLVLVATFRPIVNRWEKSVGRLAAVLIMVLIALIALATLIYLIIPPIITQLKDFVLSLPGYVDQISFLKDHIPSLEQNIDTIAKNIGNISLSFISVTTNVFAGIVIFVTAVVMVIYMLLDKKSLTTFVTSVFPPDKRDTINNLVSKIVKKLGDWLRGQMYLGIIIGVIDFIGLLIMGVPYALTLAVVAGLLEIIPTIGPIISGMLAIFVAIQISPWLALAVLIFYVLVQQLENSILVPKIMQKAVGLSPVVVILAILIGAKLLGVLGAILAVPVVTSFWVLIQEWTSISEAFEK